jgi:hypothetical protein
MAEFFTVDGSPDVPPAPAPSPKPMPAPAITPGQAARALLGLVHLPTLQGTLNVLLVVFVLWHVGQHVALPWPPFRPHPAPAPAPAPAPGPVPPAPTPAPGLKDKLYCYQIYSPSASSVEALNAASVRADVRTATQLAALDVHWRAWDSENPQIDALKLRPYLPDPAKLPVLLVFDAKGQFYDLKGNPLPRSAPVYQPHPASVEELVADFQSIRGR